MRRRGNLCGRHLLDRWKATIGRAKEMGKSVDEVAPVKGQHCRFWFIVFNWLAAVSALLCVGLIIPWCLGIVEGDQWTFPRRDLATYTVIASGNGQFRYMHGNEADSPFGPPEDSISHATNFSAVKGIDDLTLLGWRGTGVPGFRNNRARSGYAVTISYWLAFVFGAILPVAWLINRRRQQRAKRTGLCPACGYDLRATPERCPECGRLGHVTFI
jgi:hypothetical protein